MMGMHGQFWAPDDRTSRGTEPTVTPEKSTRGDLKKPGAEPPAEAPQEGSRSISGPGPNDLTRGLP